MRDKKPDAEEAKRSAAIPDADVLRARASELLREHGRLIQVTTDELKRFEELYYEEVALLYDKYKRDSRPEDMAKLRRSLAELWDRFRHAHKVPRPPRS